MKKICFVLIKNTDDLPRLSMKGWKTVNGDKLVDYFSDKYEVSIDYEIDQNNVDYLVLPTPFNTFENVRNLPIIPVDVELFQKLNLEAIDEELTKYFSEKEVTAATKE